MMKWMMMVKWDLVHSTANAQACFCGMHQLGEFVWLNMRALHLLTVSACATYRRAVLFEGS